MSAYEYELICRAARRMGMISPAPAGVNLGWASSALAEEKDMVTLDQDFCALFPSAPRFMPGDKRAQTEREDYLARVTCLDRAVGHLDIVRTRAHAAQMQQALVAPCEVSLKPRARL